MQLLSPSTPKIPDPPTPPAPPATTDTTAATDEAAERLRRRRGVASTVLAGDAATVQPGAVATKTLLGS